MHPFDDRQNVCVMAALGLQLMVQLSFCNSDWKTLFSPQSLAGRSEAVIKYSLKKLNDVLELFTASKFIVYISACTFCMSIDFIIFSEDPQQIIKGIKSYFRERKSTSVHHRKRTAFVNF